MFELQRKVLFSIPLLRVWILDWRGTDSRMSVRPRLLTSTVSNERSSSCIVGLSVVTPQRGCASRRNQRKESDKLDKIQRNSVDD